VKDYIQLGILDASQKIEEICRMAAYILQYKFKSKIMQFCDPEIKKEVFIKYLEHIIPSGIVKKYDADQWFSQMLSCYKAENVKDFDLDDCRKVFLGVFCKYPTAMSSYFWVQGGNKISSLRIPNKSLCAVNISGIHFMNEIGRRDIIYSIKYENIISVIGYKKDFQIVAHDPNLVQIVITLELKACRAREMAEDILTYSQLQLIERRYCSWVKPLESQRGGYYRKESEESSSVSMHKVLPRVYTKETVGDEERKNNEVFTLKELEKYYKTGIKHYQLVKEFLIYEQPFPLSVIPESREERKSLTIVPIEKQPILETSKDEDILLLPSSRVAKANPFVASSEFVQNEEIKKIDISGMLNMNQSMISKISDESEISKWAAELKQPDTFTEREDSGLTFPNNHTPNRSISHGSITNKMYSSF